VAQRAGGIEADLTVTRLDERPFLVVTSVSSHIRDLAWLNAHIGPDDFCTVTDVTSGLADAGPDGAALACAAAAG
jgi:glycine cleavage system aminomethyltransferase T